MSTESPSTILILFFLILPDKYPMTSLSLGKRILNLSPGKTSIIVPDTLILSLIVNLLFLVSHLGFGPSHSLEKKGFVKIHKNRIQTKTHRWVHFLKSEKGGYNYDIYYKLLSPDFDTHLKPLFSASLYSYVIYDYLIFTI